MYVLSKKRIILVVICMFVSVFAFILNEKNDKTQETVVLPVSRKNYSNRCWSWSTR